MYKLNNLHEWINCFDTYYLYVDVIFLNIFQVYKQNFYEGLNIYLYFSEVSASKLSDGSVAIHRMQKRVLRRNILSATLYTAKAIPSSWVFSA